MVIQTIKSKYGEYRLNQERKQLVRKRQSLQFNNSKDIALVFEATDEDELDLIKDFIKDLRDLKKNVKSVGYFNLKQVPPLQYSKLEYDFISQKELNWWHQPSDDFIKTFIREEFDILINLSIKNHFPLKYIASTSHAKFKIGILNDSNINDYDLLLDISKDSTIKNLLKQVKHYLNYINKPKHESSI